MIIIEVRFVIRRLAVHFLFKSPAIIKDNIRARVFKYDPRNQVSCGNIVFVQRSQVDSFHLKKKIFGVETSPVCE